MKISDAEARQILMKDIASSVQKVKTYISTKFPNKSLDQHQLKMLTDFAFNPGLSKFPVFVKAVVDKDWNTVAKEYKRYADGKELTDRNTKFYNTFIKPVLTKKSTSQGTSASTTKPAKSQPKPAASAQKPFKTGVDWMDNALKDDTYIHVVKPGDTLLAIALKH